MEAVVASLVVLGSFAAVLSGLWWLAARVRRRGAGRDLMGPIDLIYRPHTQLINIEVQVQEQRMAPMASPDDKLHP
jgi:hypothetical protein